jgi:hypothetical protein
MYKFEKTHQRPYYVASNSLETTINFAYMPSSTFSHGNAHIHIAEHSSSPSSSSRRFPVPLPSAEKLQLAPEPTPRVLDSTATPPLAVVNLADLSGEDSPPESQSFAHSDHVVLQATKTVDVEANANLHSSSLRLNGQCLITISYILIQNTHASRTPCTN